MSVEDIEPSGAQFYSRVEVMGMDKKFRDAMGSAKRKGLERFEEGTKVDLSPLVPTHFTREAIFSGCSSAAALCADETNGSSLVSRGSLSRFRGAPR